MEYIPQLVCSSILFSQIFSALFIFVTFIIVVHKHILWNNNFRKVAFKMQRTPPVDLSSNTIQDILVHCHLAVNINSDTLHDILTFFDRKSLSRLRSVDSRFNQTIRREFASVPYLLLETFCISGSTAEKSVRDRSRCIVDGEVIDTILAEKFVRFVHADITYNDRAHVAHLLSKRKLWQTFSHLVRQWPVIDLNSDTLHDILSFFDRKCLEKVNSISFRGRLTLLPEFFLGNCLKLKCSDVMFKTANSASVPWTKILDFLFRPSETYATRRHVKITTKDPPGFGEYMQFVDEMKQRFAAATSRLHFEFYWRANGTQLFHYGEHFKNVHTQQKIIFNGVTYYGKHNSSYIHLYTL